MGRRWWPTWPARRCRTSTAERANGFDGIGKIIGSPNADSLSGPDGIVIDGGGGADVIRGTTDGKA